MTTDPIAEASTPRAAEIAAWLYPEGKRVRSEWVADGLSINLGLRAGVFKNATTNEVLGNSFVLLTARARNVSVTEARAELAGFLGVEIPIEREALPARHEVTQEASPARSVARSQSSPAEAMRLLPQSPDAEQGVLASILLASRESMAYCDGRITPRHFHLEAHRIIYTAIHAMWMESEEIDIITLSEFLRNTNELDKVGGPAFISHLFLFLPTSANLAYYVEIVRVKWLAREGILAFQRGADRLYTEQDQVAEIFDETLERAKHVEGVHRLGLPSDPLVPLMDLSPGDVDPRKTVLGHRFLCLSGTMLFIGPSGIGKSSASVQQDILWSLGREAFGIKPQRPLKILVVQAENDAEDLAEMRDGVTRGLRLSDADRAEVRQRVFYETECGRTGASFLQYLEGRLKLEAFDLLRIDPLLAYLGGDVNDAAVTAEFLRAGLNPMLNRYKVACVINHHTPKVTNRDTSAWRGSDWMYAGAGSSDITNWARAALVIDPTHAGHVFKFIAAKRGTRIGWTNEEGYREMTRYFCHGSDGLYWREANAEDMAAIEEAEPKKKGKKTEKAAGGVRRVSTPVLRAKADLGKHFAYGSTQRSTKLQMECGIANGTFYRLWEQLKNEGLIEPFPGHPSIWQASKEWAKELESTYPAEER